jgi:hypothetical protein
MTGSFNTPAASIAAAAASTPRGVEKGDWGTLRCVSWPWGWKLGMSMESCCWVPEDAWGAEGGGERGVRCEKRNRAMGKKGCWVPEDGCKAEEEREGDSGTILDSILVDTILDDFCNVLGNTWRAAGGCLRMPG